MAERILLVEDEEKLARMVELELQYEGYEVEKAFDGRTGLELALSGKFDLVLLDIMLPALSGMEVLRRLRKESQMPVIMLTARDTVVDKVSGLDMGADDYVAKPFRPRELVARIQAAVRRARPERTVLRLGRVQIDPDRAHVEKDGREVTLSALEYRLLLLFAKNAGKLVTRDMMRDALWDDAGAYVEENTLSVYIKRLRDKLEDDPSAPTLIVTIRGLGYRANDLRDAS